MMASRESGTKERSAESRNSGEGTTENPSRGRQMDEEDSSKKLGFPLKTSNFDKITDLTKRLVVRTITLENFKSYQGRQVIGPLDNVSLLDSN